MLERLTLEERVWTGVTRGVEARVRPSLTLHTDTVPDSCSR